MRSTIDPEISSTQWPLILASASPRRRDLLLQLGLVPNAILAPDVDETALPQELPRHYAARMAKEKCQIIAQTRPDALVLAADTVVACGRRILPKAEDEATARLCLDLLSGRRHRVYTALALAVPGRAALSQRLVMSQVAFKRLSEQEITAYLASGEWQGKAGGYAIQGRAAAFIPWIAGSHSAVVGLPLHETSSLLKPFSA